MGKFICSKYQNDNRYQCVQYQEHGVLACKYCNCHVIVEIEEVDLAKECAACALYNDK